MHVHGVDIVEISRIEEAVKTWGDRFLNRIYTDGEREFCRGRNPELATRFAGKEAVMKALGTGWKGVSWRDIEILTSDSGAPSVHLGGGAKVRAEYLGLEELVITLSHAKHYAVASVVGTRKENGA
ncbi:MAG: holo-ACP synthase [Dehalococcoidia bacterium]